jgi:hypothetical protein
MGNPFKAKTKIVEIPQQSTTQGSSSIQPYAPVVPYIESLLPQIQSTFTEAPALFTESLVPEQTAATQQAYDLYGQVGAQSAALSPMFQNLMQQQLGIAQAAPGTSAIFEAQTGALANQARAMTERDKQIAQQQAMEAGQFGLGSTALGEMQTLQQRQREELVQQQLAQALGQEDVRRQQALGTLPGLAQQYLGATATQASMQEAIGRSQEQQRAAELADAARLAQQRQEAERLQVTNLANLLGGLAGLGSQTSYQQAMQGTTSQAIQQPSLFQQVAGPLAQAGSAAMAAFSDIRLKTEIKRVGKLPNGIPVYRWEWTKEAKEIVKGQPSFGVLAQEVLDVMPDAVTVGTDGYYRVDYGKVLNG